MHAKFVQNLFPGAYSRRSDKSCGGSRANGAELAAKQSICWILGGAGAQISLHILTLFFLSCPPLLPIAPI